ncbi:MFS transporter [Chloroflexota bacterium]
MKKPKVFYGYWIVAVAFLCMFTYAGVGYYCFSLFYKPLEAEFSWSRGAISAAFTIYFVIQGLASPFVGRMVDRYGARKLITLGALISGLGFFWLSFMQDLYSFYAGYVVIGLGATAMGPIPSTQMVSNWFTKRRGFAIGIMSTGIGIGAFVLAPTVGAYFIPTFGWRVSYLALAILIWLLIIPTALLLAKTKPADIGLYPDGTETPEAAAEVNLSSQAPGGWTISMALKTSAFWLIAVAFTISNFSHTATILHQVNYLTDIGFPVATAAVALGAVGFGSAIGKLAFGWLCDSIPAKYAATISLVLRLSAVILLIVMTSTSPLAMIWLYAILMGMGAGGWLPTMSMVISSNFGIASYGALFGVVCLAQSLGDAFGPLVAGQMFDAMETYFWVFVLLIVLLMAAIPSMLAVRPPKFRLASSI